MHPRKKGQYMGSQSNREHYTFKELRSPGELEYRNQGLGKGGNCHTLQGLPTRVKDFGLYPKRSSKIKTKSVCWIFTELFRKTGRE